ncbi:Hypothetical predicted protein [Cloeon dipterum]|uniref:Gustatory receptor n=1 Tax=Cloeon dipterum TaxID=197152 RepID=A0A8S1E4V2_9INSE|nr:Hypothetical predicted protein [Cloeon dipterum]
MSSFWAICDASKLFLYFWHCSRVTLAANKLKEGLSRLMSSNDNEYFQEELRFMVSKVFECCDIANGYFGVFSLMYIIHTSVHIQNNLFEAGKIVCSLLLGQGSLENDTLSIWVRLITALACFLRLLSYVWCTTRLTFESNKMAALLVRVSNEVVCNSLKEQVYWFAEEVRWNKIGFTANGLFNIDRELLFMAAGSCATNMAILLQAYISK